MANDGEYHEAGQGEAGQPRRSPPAPGWPGWVKGGVALGMMLALAVAFLTRTLFQRGDWSDGALAVGVSAGLLAVIALFFAIIRALEGHRAPWTLIQAGLLILLLAVIAAGSVAVSPSLHATQARAALDQGQWEQAIEEYTLSGERAPHAPDIASAYVAWGEQLLARQQYASASQKFIPVITTYAGSGHTVVTRARHDLYRAYSQWLRTHASEVSYGGAGGAIATFQQYRADPACDAACHVQLPATLAQAYYAYGQQLMASQRYAEAITQFETVASQYASSAYASQARAAAAQAYLQRGQQQIALQACSDAVTTYRLLIARYANSPEAARAQAALAAPQPVSGVLTGMPTSPIPTVALSAHVNISGYVFSSDYTATPDASGAFTLPNVAQGAYNLSTRRVVKNVISYTYYHDAQGKLYTVQVEPLCPVDLGAIAYQS